MLFTQVLCTNMSTSACQTDCRTWGLAKDETDPRPYSLRLFFNHEGDSDSVIKGKAPSPFPAKIQWLINGVL